jgi:hypothetical protein
VDSESDAPTSTRNLRELWGHLAEFLLSVC